MKPKTLIKKLTDNYLTRELLADKFGKSVRTIERWSAGETKPSYIEEKYLRQIYNGYKSRRENGKS